MKIIQVLTSSFGGTIGLGDDGKLYRWVNNGGIWVPNWQERKPLLYEDVSVGESGHATVAQTPSQPYAQQYAGPQGPEPQPTAAGGSVQPQAASAQSFSLDAVSEQIAGVATQEPQAPSAEAYPTSQ